MWPSALKGMGSARHHPHSGQRILCRSMHSLDRVPPMGMCRSMHGAVPFLWSAPPHSGQHGVSGAIVPLNVRMSTSRYLGSAFVPMFLRSFDRTGAPRWTKPSSPLPNQRAPPPLPDRGWHRVVVASIGRAFPSSSPCVAAIDDAGGPACCQVPAFKPTGPSFLWPHRKNARPFFTEFQPLQLLRIEHKVDG